MMLKKITALLLSFVMIITLSPVNAFTANEPDVESLSLSEEEEIEYLKQVMEQLPIGINGIGAAILSPVKTAQDPEDTLTVASNSVTAEYDYVTYSLTVSRPKGMDAKYPVSIDYRFLAGSIGIGDNPFEGGRLTIEPGETTQTIDVDIPDEAADETSWDGGKTFFVQFHTPHRTSINYDLVTIYVTKTDSTITLYDGTPVSSFASFGMNDILIGQAIPLVIAFYDDYGDLAEISITNEHILTVMRNSDNSTTELLPLEAGSTG
jgi:hypothetical protein